MDHEPDRHNLFLGTYPTLHKITSKSIITF